MKRASTRLDPILVPKSNSRLFVNVTTLHPTCDRGPAYVVRTNYPWKIVMPPQGGDKAATTRKSKNENYLGGRLSQNSTNFPLSTTLSQSKYYHCDILAVNGGPFGKDGFSTGPTVVEKKLVRTHNDSLDSSFVGIGNSLDSKWVMGTYRDIMQMNGRDSRSLLDYFVTGFGWLVYNSQIVASNAQNPTGADRAPRTAFGLDRESNMLLAVVDGCELCSHRKGPTLEELAALLLEHGASYAINMDGGGSSTMIRDTNQILNRPTCLDVPFPSCQRKVATVHCISSSGW